MENINPISKPELLKMKRMRFHKYTEHCTEKLDNEIGASNDNIARQPVLHNEIFKTTCGPMALSTNKVQSTVNNRVKRSRQETRCHAEIAAIPLNELYVLLHVFCEKKTAWRDF